MNLSNNLHNNRSLIPNANTYICQKKYVSISSEDRDIVKYPSSSFFEIELPQDYVNVQTVKLSQWSFPANYNVFSKENYNLIFLFRMTDVYNPSKNNVTDPLLVAIYQALSINNYANDFLLQIEPGFYNPTQMATELTNKMNESVTNYLVKFFTENSEYNYALTLFNEYTDFVVVYNSVQQKLFFGNRNSGFEFPNDSEFYQAATVAARTLCSYGNGKEIYSFANWGLPSYIGFTRCSENSTTAINVNQYRFYYGNVLKPGDNGIWITPSPYPGAKVHFIEAVYKINFMGPAYIYLELDGLNCIDETTPYSLTKFTIETNQTNGVVNSAFAKIAVPTTPISQWFDDDHIPYKWFDPPADRIRRLRFRIRYHNGILVNFASFDWSIMLEFTLLTNQIERTSNIKMFCGK